MKRDLYRDITEISREACRIAREMAGEERLYEIVGENVSGDSSRRIDLVLEDFIVEEILRRGYSAYILTEERGAVASGPEPELVFIVDPLDGSSNYVSDTPYVSVSIAVARRGRGSLDQLLLAGAVAEVFRDRVYGFISGEGAFVNNTRVYSRRTPEKIVVVYMEDPRVVKTVYEIWNVLGRPKMRSYGSAALDIVKTALGHFTAFIDLRGRLRNVDIAAAYGFAKTIGSRIGDHVGNEIAFDIERIDTVKSIIVSPLEEVFSKIIEVVKRSLV